MYDNMEYNELMIDYLLATSVALHFGLGAEYFSKAFRDGKTSLNQDIILHKQFNILFVKLPPEAMELLRNKYIAVKLNCDDCDSDFDYILQLTQQTRIGFWR